MTKEFKEGYFGIPAELDPEDDKDAEIVKGNGYGHRLGVREPAKPIPYKPTESAKAAGVSVTDQQLSDIDTVLGKLAYDVAHGPETVVHMEVRGLVSACIARVPASSGILTRHKWFGRIVVNYHGNWAEESEDWRLLLSNLKKMATEDLKRMSLKW